jgi:multiple sugar transport system ATP-binding protein
MAALTIRDVYKRFHSVEVLKGIDLEMDSGDFTVLVGPSGCGKSTLLNIIAGLERQSSGNIEIGGASWITLRPGTAISRWSSNPTRFIRP